VTLLGRLGSGTVTHLDLSWNDLGIEGGKAILDGMQAWWPARRWGELPGLVMADIAMV